MDIWNDGRTMTLRRNRNGNRFDVVPGSTLSGWHQLEIQGGDGTGIYRIRVRVNNICMVSNGRAMYPWAGGADGYAFDLPADTSTPWVVEPHHESTRGFLGDNWDWYWEKVPDEDWFKAPDLRAGQEYEIRVWATDTTPARHQATDLRILGIYDHGGDLVPGTQGSGSGSSVITTFEPDAGGRTTSPWDPEQATGPASTASPSKRPSRKRKATGTGAGPARGTAATARRSPR